MIRIKALRSKITISRREYPFIRSVSVLALIIILSACGGGGGSNDSTPDAGITLLSITFPLGTNPNHAPNNPPLMAPLSQQIVFTFNAEVKGKIDPDAILISADPGLYYHGPSAVLDQVKNMIVARGTFDVIDNLIVFIPFIPLGEIDLSPTAQFEHIPGLLPGYTYTVFVPVATQDSIPNLVGVDASVQNPIVFTTVSQDLPSLYFSNIPALPPKVISTQPMDGSQKIPVKSFSRTLGDSLYEEIVITFDQPLDFGFDNLKGKDLNGNGVRDQNLYLEYTDPGIFLAVDPGPEEEGYLARLNRNTNVFEPIGPFMAGSQNIRLHSVVMTERFDMLGCDGQRLFDVAYKEGLGAPPQCSLSNERLLNGVDRVIGLTITRDNSLLAVDATVASLINIEEATGEVQILGTLSPGLGDIQDMALGRDNALYALRVYQPGTPQAMASIERIDSISFQCTPLVQGLLGDYTSLVFSRDRHLLLFDANLLRWVEVDLADGQIIASGNPLADPLLNTGDGVNLCVHCYELGMTPELLDNGLHGAAVRLDPSGVLPFNAWIDIMVRNALSNLTGGSLSQQEGPNALGACSVARFKTFDPGPGLMEDSFMETFLDNAYEGLEHEYDHAKAVWNIQDQDGEAPKYEHLLAGLGLSGCGELGDFVPKPEVAGIVYLDTEYQPLPLFNGSTPGIIQPMVVQGGEFHFRDIIIPSGVTVTARGSNPLKLTATGRVEIAGTIDLSGSQGIDDESKNSAFLPAPGGAGGPGGGRGGRGQPPMPPDFKALTLLTSAPQGERGWGPGNMNQTGGGGGDSGADGPGVPIGSTHHEFSRGAGGGGGSFLQVGYSGYPGLGRYGINEKGEFFERKPWDYWDGSYKYVPGWDPSSGPPPEDWKINQWFAKDGHNHPHGGDLGVGVFIDSSTDNDFIGTNGELDCLQGGQGGGGGGSRLDCLNPEAAVQAGMMIPPLPPCSFDAKGGGGGGGGGALSIHSLGEIRIKDTGRILAYGGRGGTTEYYSHCNFGGGGGGGSGGAIVLNSGQRIIIEFIDSDHCGILDVSGGWGADAKKNTNLSLDKIVPCEIKKKTGKLKYNQWCSYTPGDGGYGGYGLIQLMVPDPLDPDQLDFRENSVMAWICQIDHEPNYEKTKGDKGTYSFYHYTLEGLGPGGTKPFIQHFPRSLECLVPPEKTASHIGPRTYVQSKWIDMGRLIDRPPIGEKSVPLLTDFEGIVAECGWGLVHTQNGYVVNAHIQDLNDIVVHAPDLAQADYIPETNEVGIQFQGTDAYLPGSKVPAVSPDVISEWTPELSSLSARQFVRFRIRFDVAKNTPLKPANTKPQVNQVRLRFRY